MPKLLPLGASDSNCLRRKAGTGCGNAGSPTIFVTIHPSAISRSRDKETREAEFGQFVADPKKVVIRLDRGAEK
jgi:hypothetical protein